MKRLLLVAFALLSLVTGGCATITSGTAQTIAVETRVRIEQVTPIERPMIAAVSEMLSPCSRGRLRSP